MGEKVVRRLTDRVRGLLLAVSPKNLTQKVKAQTFRLLETKLQRQLSNTRIHSSATDHTEGR